MHAQEDKVYQLAQLNIATMRFPLDDPRFKDFVDALDPVNAVADASPGFVWRLQTESGNATDVRVAGDENLLVNLSVWRSVEHLKTFVRCEAHLRIMRRRHEWFEPDESAYLVLWWVPSGHLPSTDEARSRLIRLQNSGPSAEAFDFRQPYPPPNGAD